MTDTWATDGKQSMSGFDWAPVILARVVGDNSLDAEVGASCVPIAHRLARGGRFHLCDFASKATRVGLSNRRDLIRVETEGGRPHRRAQRDWRSQFQWLNSLWLQD